MLCCAVLNALASRQEHRNGTEASHAAKLGDSRKVLAVVPHAKKLRPVASCSSSTLRRADLLPRADSRCTHPSFVDVSEVCLKEGDPPGDWKRIRPQNLQAHVDPTSAASVALQGARECGTLSSNFKPLPNPPEEL